MGMAQYIVVRQCATHRLSLRHHMWSTGNCNGSAAFHIAFPQCRPVVMRIALPIGTAALWAMKLAYSTSRHY